MTDRQNNRPVALLIEDRPELIKATQNLFNVSGFQSICVRTAAEALREFIATPAVDIVIADINLDQSNHGDVSGVDVATTIRSMRPDLPIVAVSGRVGQLDDRQAQPFTDSLVKGKPLTLQDYDTKLDQWRQDAIAYRERRSMSGKQAVEALDARDDFEPIDYEVVREFLPGRQRPEHRNRRSESPSSPEDVLRQAGWWLRLLQAGHPVRDNGDAVPRTRLAILVWVNSSGGMFTAVLHGFSSVTYRGATLDDAVDGLMKLMRGYHAGAVPLGPDIGEAERPRLLSHLAAVFE